MSRSTDEWVAKHDDQKVPARVRARVFEKHGGICWISKRLIRPGEAWDLDHMLALCNGGRHAEFNLAPALKEPHRQKTAEDVALRAKTDRIRAKHLGLSFSARPFPKRADPWGKNWRSR